MELCKEDEHTMDSFFNVGGGSVWVGCTKCAYWEPHENDPSIEVTITYT